MKTLTNLFMIMLVITLVIFYSQAQGKKTIATKKELKKTNRIYKINSNYKYTTSEIGIGCEVRNHRKNKSSGTNWAIKKTHSNRKKIKSGTIRTNDSTIVRPATPPGIPIPYPNILHDLKEVGKSKVLKTRKNQSNFKE